MFVTQTGLSASGLTGSTDPVSLLGNAGSGSVPSDRLGRGGGDGCVPKPRAAFTDCHKGGVARRRLWTAPCARAEKRGLLEFA